MPQKCRVKHMCMRLLVQASGNKHACRVPCLQGALPAALLSVHPSWWLHPSGSMAPA